MAAAGRKSRQELREARSGPPGRKTKAAEAAEACGPAGAGRRAPGARPSTGARSNEFKIAQWRPKLHASSPGGPSGVASFQTQFMVSGAPPSGARYLVRSGHRPAAAADHDKPPERNKKPTIRFLGQGKFYYNTLSWLPDGRPRAPLPNGPASARNRSARCLRSPANEETSTHSRPLGRPHGLAPIDCLQSVKSSENDSASWAQHADAGAR